VRLEDLRADAHFPDQDTDAIIESIEKHFEYLNTFKRPDWDRRYALYADARQALEKKNVPWRSVLAPYVFRSDDSFGPALGTHFWIHAGPLHLLLCLFFLWLAGSHMEETWGSLVTFLTYVGGGLASATAVHFAMPGGEWTLLGGTAAVSALMGGLMVRAFSQPIRFFYILGVTYGVFTLPAWTSLPVWAAAVAHIGWFTDGRLDGLPAALFHGTGFVWGMAVGGLTGLGRGREEASSGSDVPFLLTRRVDKAADLFKTGKRAEARDLCQGVLEADPTHLPAMKELIAIHESLQDEDSAARVAIRIIRTALEQGQGQLAEETFRKWSLRLFQAKVPPQESLIIGKNL
jgi:membrane associated rhomboid family serine protease